MTICTAPRRKNRPTLLVGGKIALVVVLAIVMKIHDRSTSPGWHHRVSFMGHTSVILALAFSPDGTRLASGDDEGNLLVGDWQSGTHWSAAPDEHGRILSLAFTPSGSTLICGRKEGAVQLWDVAGAQLERTLLGHNSGVFSVSCTGDGRTLATGSGGGVVKIWDLPTGQARASWNIHANAFTSLAISPGGELLAVGSLDLGLQWWDVATGREQTSPQGPSAAIYALAFAEDGHTLVAGCGDGSVRVWDVSSRTLVNSLKLADRSVLGVGVSANGRTIIAGSLDGLMRVWDMDRGGDPAIWEHKTSFNAYVKAVALARDGCRFAVGMNDSRSVEGWELSTSGGTALPQGQPAPFQAASSIKSQECSPLAGFCSGGPRIGVASFCSVGKMKRSHFALHHFALDRRGFGWHGRPASMEYPRTEPVPSQCSEALHEPETPIRPTAGRRPDARCRFGTLANGFASHHAGRP
jgi:WD40 repeat protein